MDKNMKQFALEIAFIAIGYTTLTIGMFVEFLDNREYIWLSILYFVGGTAHVTFLTHDFYKMWVSKKKTI